jgi:glycosyltransferase involved in cell wall biosynthesis
MVRAEDAGPFHARFRDVRARRSQSRPQPTVSVVVPTLNQAENLPLLFARLPDEVSEVVIVDGRSTDGTADVARSLDPDVRVLHEERPGKGNALTRGFAAARGDIIVALDADNSADPAEIARFVNALHEGADYAKGSCFVDGGGSSDITWLRWLGNRARTVFGQSHLHAFRDGWRALRTIVAEAVSHRGGR